MKITDENDELIIKEIKKYRAYLQQANVDSDQKKSNNVICFLTDDDTLAERINKYITNHVFRAFTAITKVYNNLDLITSPDFCSFLSLIGTINNKGVILDNPINLIDGYMLISTAADTLKIYALYPNPDNDFSDNIGVISTKNITDDINCAMPNTYWHDTSIPIDREIIGY